MNNQYTQLRQSKLIIGRGSIDFLSTLGKKRAAIIYDGRLLDSKGKEKFVAILARGGCEACFVSDIRNEPFFDDVLRTVEAARDYKPDLFVALGGGSVIDTAKAAWLLYEHPEMSLEDTFKPYQFTDNTSRTVMAAIPTTSGTGSETTCCAVLTNQENMQKRLILSHSIIPSYAILDADFTDSLPSSIAAYTGMDALAHAMEASVCKISSPMVVSLALEAALDVLENLPAAVNAATGSREQAYAREICHYGAALAGIAISNACAGMVHALDQAGPCFSIPHGLVCGVLLPYTTAFHSPHPSYVKLGRRLGYVGEDMEVCRQLVRHLQTFNESIGIARGFAELGIDEKAFMCKLNDFTDAALVSHAATLSPKKPTREEAQALLRAAYYGDVV